MINLTFWNIRNNKSCLNLISNDISEHSPGIFIFSEYWSIYDYVANFHFKSKVILSPVYKRIGIIHSSNIELTTIENCEYYIISKFKFSDIYILLIAVHLKSKYGGEGKAHDFNSVIVKELFEKDCVRSNENVIVAGDFNLYHYDDIFYKTEYLNTRTYIGKRGSKKIGSQAKMTYYAPISALGGFPAGNPPGTYYYNVAYRSQAWHIFDQFLLSHSLGKIVVDGSSKICSTLGGEILYDPPNTINMSDHLPITLSLLR